MIKASTIRKNIFDDDNGQLVLMACLSIAIFLVLISVYEYSTLTAGGGSINRENMGSTYFYIDLRDRYENVYSNTYLNMSKTTNITVFEKEMREFALLHGYSVNFIRNETTATIIFVDKDMKIIEQVNK